jgi:outer membrane protein
MLRSLLLRGVTALAVAAGGGAGAAGAETLTDALIRAYRTSPLLEASRAALRGLDENIAQARANRRPQISGFASGTSNRRLRTGTADSDVLSAGVQASLLLYDGGETEAAIQSAIATVSAARADLRSVEQIVLFDAVEAYMDVRRNIEFVSLAESDVRVLEEQLEAARQRFEVGEVTRTDVSLTEAQLAASRSALVAAEGQLDASEANYLAAVGSPPNNLQPPPPEPALPAGLAEATAIALRRNPDIVAAQYAERAAVYDYERALAARRPELSVEGQVNWQDFGEDGIDTERRDVLGQVGVTASVPLYSGGAISSLIRQALTLVEQRQSEVQARGREVTEDVAAAWTQLEVAEGQIPARREQVEAARIAAEGTLEEARLGARSILDVLETDQDLLTAEADLVQAIRDEYVAAYNLLRAMGLLTVDHLDLGIETYDPDIYFTQVQAAPIGGTRSEVVDRIRARWE